MEPLSEPIRRNLVDYIHAKYKAGVYQPYGRTTYPHKPKSSAWWVPRQYERASCCKGIKNTKNKATALYKHCTSKKHLNILSKENPKTILAHLPIDYNPAAPLTYYLQAFDIERAPTLIHSPDVMMRTIAHGTLKNSYTI
jgi:hypothetical protein